jgi:D-alanyl-D-alanine-carboxypeptidase/D-alanyl-D-alanine-endopeptidase
MCAYWPNFNCDNYPAREALHINLTMANSSHRKSLVSDLEIRQILARRLGDPRNEIGIVVGVVEPNGRRIVTHRPHAFDGDTVFEIGSVTKVFTALLLADMVLCDEVAFSDPVAKWLPPHVRVPARNGREMTLMDLASHTSGLPRMPSNFKPADPFNLSFAKTRPPRCVSSAHTVPVSQDLQA